MVWSLIFSVILYSKQSGHPKEPLVLWDAGHVKEPIHCYLTLLCAGGLQMSVENFFHDIRKEAGNDNNNDGEPGGTTGQELDKDKVHVLGVEEGPVEK